MLFILRKLPQSWLLTGLLLVSFSGTAADTVAAQRQVVSNMATTVLNELYEIKPTVKGLMKNAYGYAVFNNDNVNMLLATSEGYGMAKNSRTGEVTYMLLEDEAGNFGEKDKVFKLVLLFKKAEAFDEFVSQDWSNVQAKPFSELSQYRNAYQLYQLTDGVLEISPSIKDVKFWINEKLQ